ncbi:MAG: helix-turn-helix domain-containing protein [Culicoidibacterales bacterium]
MKKLKALRVLHGISQRQFAEKMGIRQTTYSKKENTNYQDQFKKREIDMIISILQESDESLTYETIFKP